MLTIYGSPLQLNLLINLNINLLNQLIFHITNNITIYSSPIKLLKGCRMGRSDKVSLWYVALLINTRFRFFILE